MDKLVVLLQNMGMEYYQGIRFLSWASRPNYNWWLDRRFKDYYTLQFNAAGKIHFIMDSGPRLILNAPVVWLTFPGPHFLYGTQDGSVWHHQYVAFAGPRVKAYIKSGLFPIYRRPPVISIWQGERFHDAFNELIERLETGSINNHRAVNILEGLFLQLHEQRSPAFMPESSPMASLRRLAESIEKNPAKEWDFRREANAMHISYDRFRHLFNRVIGQAPRQFVLRHRMHKAAIYLRTTNLPIKAIAEQTGIHDIYYFSRLFRLTYHMPPGVYRTQFEGDYDRGYTIRDIIRS